MNNSLSTSVLFSLEHLFYLDSSWLFINFLVREGNDSAQSLGNCVVSLLSCCLYDFGRTLVGDCGSARPLPVSCLTFLEDWSPSG